MRNRLEYKLDLLQMEAQGFNRTEIVKHLADKYHVSEKIGYYYFKTRAHWQPEIIGLEDAKDAYHQTLNRLEYIYRRFGVIAASAPEFSNRVGALKGMLETVTRKAQITGVLAPADFALLEIDDELDEEAFKSMTPDENQIIMQATQLFLHKKEAVEHARGPQARQGEKRDQ